MTPCGLFLNNQTNPHETKTFTLFLYTGTSHVGSSPEKGQRTTAYAITGAERGGHRWTEVNLVDATTGEVIAPVYQSKSEVKRLNARTGKPIAVAPAAAPARQTMTQLAPGKQTGTITTVEEGIVVVRKMAPMTADVQTLTVKDANGNERTVQARRVMIRSSGGPKEDPFATTSAACAYDKKNNRLYYTPLGINQLRYIDLKAKEPSVCYFEEEAFGTTQGMGDVANQITRMVMAADGKGYALSNDAQQLIQFNTKRKPVITNLGAVTDDPSNGRFSINGRSAYGGDLVADDRENLYLLTANRRVYRIALETRVAKYLGSISGLPEGFTTNGAVVEDDNHIIVSSSQSTSGYYRVNMENLQAEKLTNGTVFNASDLANDRLLSIRKKKRKRSRLNWCSR